MFKTLGNLMSRSKEKAVYATERRRLLMSLKAAVNSVLVKFVERQQPLTEEDAEALDLCYALESCLFHELKGKTRAAEDAACWQLIRFLGKQHRMAHGLAIQAVANSTTVVTEGGLCRAWLRKSMNQNGLEYGFEHLFELKTVMRQVYKKEALFMDHESSVIFLDLLKSFNRVAFDFDTNAGMPRLQLPFTAPCSIHRLQSYTESLNHATRPPRTADPMGAAAVPNGVANGSVKDESHMEEEEKHGSEAEAKVHANGGKSEKSVGTMEAPSDAMDDAAEPTNDIAAAVTSDSAHEATDAAEATAVAPTPAPAAEQSDKGSSGFGKSVSSGDLANGHTNDPPRPPMLRSTSGSNLAAPPPLHPLEAQRVDSSSPLSTQSLHGINSPSTPQRKSFGNRFMTGMRRFLRRAGSDSEDNASRRSGGEDGYGSSSGGELSSANEGGPGRPRGARTARAVRDMRHSGFAATGASSESDTPPLVPRGGKRRSRLGKGNNLLSPVSEVRTIDSSASTALTELESVAAAERSMFDASEGVAFMASEGVDRALNPKTLHASLLSFLDDTTAMNRSGLHTTGVNASHDVSFASNGNAAGAEEDLEHGSIPYDWAKPLRNDGFPWLSTPWSAKSPADTPATTERLAPPGDSKVADTRRASAAFSSPLHQTAPDAFLMKDRREARPEPKGRAQRAGSIASTATAPQHPGTEHILRVRKVQQLQRVRTLLAPEERETPLAWDPSIPKQVRAKPRRISFEQTPTPVSTLLKENPDTDDYAAVLAQRLEAVKSVHGFWQERRSTRAEWLQSLREKAAKEAEAAGAIGLILNSTACDDSDDGGVGELPNNDAAVTTLGADASAAVGGGLAVQGGEGMQEADAGDAGDAGDGGGSMRDTGHGAQSDAAGGVAPAREDTKAGGEPSSGGGTKATEEGKESDEGVKEEVDATAATEAEELQPSETHESEEEERRSSAQAGIKGAAKEGEGDATEASASEGRYHGHGSGEGSGMASGGADESELSARDDNAPKLVEEEGGEASDSGAGQSDSQWHGEAEGATRDEAEGEGAGDDVDDADEERRAETEESGNNDEDGGEEEEESQEEKEETELTPSWAVSSAAAAAEFQHNEGFIARRQALLKRIEKQKELAEGKPTARYLQAVLEKEAAMKRKLPPRASSRLSERPRSSVESLRQSPGLRSTSALPQSDLRRHASDGSPSLDHLRPGFYGPQPLRPGEGASHRPISRNSQRTSPTSMSQRARFTSHDSGRTAGTEFTEATGTGTITGEGERVSDQPSQSRRRNRNLAPELTAAAAANAKRASRARSRRRLLQAEEAHRQRPQSAKEGDHPAVEAKEEDSASAEVLTPSSTHPYLSPDPLVRAPRPTETAPAPKSASPQPPTGLATPAPMRRLELEDEAQQTRTRILKALLDQPEPLYDTFELCDVTATVIGARKVQERNDSAAYVEYGVRVQLTRATNPRLNVLYYSVWHRYSVWRRLRDRLKEEYPKATFPAVPGWSLRSSLSTAFIAERKAKLEEFLLDLMRLVTTRKARGGSSHSRQPPPSKATKQAMIVADLGVSDHLASFLRCVPSRTGDGPTYSGLCSILSLDPADVAPSPWSTGASLQGPETPVLGSSPFLVTPTSSTYAGTPDSRSSPPKATGATAVGALDPRGVTFKDHELPKGVKLRRLILDRNAAYVGTAAIAKHPQFITPETVAPTVLGREPGDTHGALPLVQPPNDGRTEQSIIEAQLKYQQHACAGCGAPLAGSGSGGGGSGGGPKGGRRSPRECLYTGLLYCSNCHSEQRRPIPSRIIHAWDMAPAPVCNAVASFLDATVQQPCLALSVVNPSLLHQVTQLRHCRLLRLQLHFMRPCIATCPRRSTLLSILEPSLYHLEHVDVWSLHDLERVPEGALARFLSEAVNKLARHITQECSSCSRQGSECTICSAGRIPKRKPHLLFPFDITNVTQCPTCDRYYHSKCLEEAGCPACRM